MRPLILLLSFGRKIGPGISTPKPLGYSRFVLIYERPNFYPALILVATWFLNKHTIGCCVSLVDFILISEKRDVSFWTFN